MSDSFKPTDLRDALFYIGNFLHAGIAPADALADMMKIQPAHANFWQEASQGVQHGFALSHVLRSILPAETLSAFKSAEATGTLDEVLSLIEQTYNTQETVTNALRSLIKPCVMVIVGLAMFLFFAVVVIPPLAKTLPAGGNDPLLAFTSMLNSLYLRYGSVLGIVLGGLMIAALLWFRDPHNRESIVSAASMIPVLGPALTNLYFGLWAFHMATSTKAGIVVTDALRLTHAILPHYLQPAILRVADDTVRFGLIGASDPVHRPDDDPRQVLPRFIVTAFRMAERTGDADKAFLAAGTSLVKQSVRQIMVFATTAEHIILPIAGILIGGSILPYFTQLGNAMDHLR